jgi:hypothetical protein
MRGKWPALLVVFLLPLPLPASEAAPAPAQAEYDLVRDLEIQVRARRMLQEDQELAPFNLGVTVRNGAAVVWGPVSSAEIQAKALKKVENVRGVFSVRGAMYVAPEAGKPPQPGATKLLPDVSEETGADAPDWRTGRLPSQTTRLASKQSDQRAGPPKTVRLKTPIVLAEEPTVVNGDVAGAIERIRAADERYRLIRYEMKDAAIYVRGDAKPEHAMAFARAIANLPGVERVILSR